MASKRNFSALSLPLDFRPWILYFARSVAIEPSTRPRVVDLARPVPGSWT